MKLTDRQSDNDRGDSKHNSDLGQPSGVCGIGRSEVRCSSHQFKPFFIERHTGAFDG